MKLQDAIKQLSARLPLLTEELTDTIAVTSIVHAGTTATIITDEPHGLLPNNSVHVLGAVTPIQVTISHAVDTTVAVAITAVENTDLTLFSTFSEGNVVVMSGANEADFNGTFPLIEVVNRRIFHFTVDVDAPLFGTGTIFVENGSNIFRTVRGQYPVATVEDSTTLTVEHTAASDLGTLTGTITLRAKPRISGGLDVESIMKGYTLAEQDSVTEERAGKTWLYVVLGDVPVSRGRDARLDAIDIQKRSMDWQQYILVPIQLLLVQTTTDMTNAREGRDNAERLFRPILRSILGKAFDSYLASGPCGEVQFVGHGFARYDGATYWHEFDFEQRELIGFDDTIGDEDHVAFRDWDLTADPDLDSLDGEGEIVQITDLDDEPI